MKPDTTMATTGRDDVMQTAEVPEAGRATPPALKPTFDWKWVVIGVCVAFTVYIAVIPLGFLLWQSFRTPQIGGGRRGLHARQLRRGLRQQRHAAAVLDLAPVRVRHGGVRLRGRHDCWRG